MIPTLQLGGLGRASQRNGPPPLDGFTTALWAAYGLQRILTSYTGALIRIRDSTTTTETDIGYEGSTNRVDQAAILTAIGAHSATIVKFYDQSGNARDLVQTGTTTKQPLIANAGTIETSSGSVKATFDGTDDCMQTPNLPGSNAAMSYVMYGAIRAFPGSGFAVWLESTADAGSNAGLGLYYQQSLDLIINVTGPPSTQSFTRLFPADKPNDNVTVTTGNRATSIIQYYRAGSIVTPHSSSGGTNTGNYAASPLNVGARNNGATLPAQLDLKALAVYTSVLNATDIAAISAALVI